MEKKWIAIVVTLILSVLCADALEFSGEVAQLTGAQTTDIIWDKNNFGGFCYNLSDDACISTETLAIGAGTLTGPDIDRTIETNALTYTTSPIWREYELHKNLGLTVESDHYSGDSGYWIEFWMGEEYVAIAGRADKLAKPLVEFNSIDTKTLATGEEWDLGGGFTLEATWIDLEGEKVWFCLCKNGKEIDSEMISVSESDLQKRVYTCTEDVGWVDDIPIFSCYVSAAFRGTCSNIVRIKYVFLIDDDVTEIDTGDDYDRMEVVTASSSGVTLMNDVPINLTLNTTAPIMGNLSFKISDNTSAIDFYPHLIRNELPVLSGGGGFVLDDCQIDSAWNLSENYSIAAKDVALNGDKARIILLKNDVVVDEVLLTEEFEAPVDSDSHYSYVKNEIEIINATLKAAFRGNDSNVVELREVYQCSEVDGSILINNESHLFKSADPAGIPWYLADGYVLTMKDVGFNGDEVWLELLKNGAVVKEKISDEDSAFTYTSGSGSINCVVDTVFRGFNANAVKLVNVSQYSDINGTALLVDEPHLYKTSDPEGMPWELMDSYVLTVKDLNSDDVWLELSKDDIVLNEDILESGDLFEYKNGLESVDCMVEAVFKGCWADVVKLKNVNQYSNTGAQLIDNESKTYVTTDPPVVDIWERWEGYSLALKDIGLNGDEVWLSLSKDDVVVKDAIIDSRKCDVDRWFKYYTATGALVFSTYIDAVFRGTNSCIVQLIPTTQYSEIDGKLFIEPSTESWQLEEGYYLTAQEVYWNNSVWLQLSKNDKLVDEGLFYGNISFSLQNDIAGHTIVSGTISGSCWDYDYVQLTYVTQYYEANGTVLATWQTKTLNTSQWSFKNDKKTLSIPPRFPKTLTVDDGGGADFTSIRAATNRAILGDTIYVHAGTYVGTVRVYTERLTLIGEGVDVVTVSASSEEGPVFDVTADYVNISGFTVTGANDGYYSPPAGIYLGGIYSSRSGVDHCNISGNNVYGNHYGIFLRHSSNNTLQNNTANSNYYEGICLSSSNNNTLQSNNASNNKYGIRMSSSNNNTLQSNTMSGNIHNFGVSGNSLSNYTHHIDASNTVDGKPIYYWVNQQDNQIPSDAGFVGVVNSTNITVRDLTLTKNCNGVLFAYTDNSRIENVIASDNCHGIYLKESSSNTLTNNTASDNGGGIDLWSSSNNTLQNNTANSNNDGGIDMSDSSNNTLQNNNASNNNRYGIRLSDSGNNTLKSNTMSGNARNFDVYGHSISHHIQNIDASNMVDGKPIYYWVNQKDTEVPDDAGFVRVVNSTNITVRDLTLINADMGVLFAYTDNSRIENVNASNNDKHGIYLWNSSNNTLSNNTCLNNKYNGIYLEGSSNNTLTDNNASDNGEGINLWSSSNNTLTGNIASNNDYGIALSYHSSNNTLTGNNVSGNYHNGICLYHSSNNNLTDNNVSNNRYGIGIYLEGSSNNTLTGNNASDNGEGINLWSSSNNTLTDNNASNNNICGIQLSDSGNNTLTDNNVSNNIYGIYLWWSSSSNSITCNLVQNNTDQGFRLDSGSANNNISYNNIIENGNYNKTSGGWKWQFYNGQSNHVEAKHNHWGAGMNNSTIDASIYDDEEGGGRVEFYPFETDLVPCTPTPEEPPMPVFTTADAVIALQVAAGSRPFDSRWDVSGDGHVTSLDALMILQAAGRIESSGQPR